MRVLVTALAPAIIRMVDSGGADKAGRSGLISVLNENTTSPDIPMPIKVPSVLTINDSHSTSATSLRQFAPMTLSRLNSRFRSLNESNIMTNTPT